MQEIHRQRYLSALGIDNYMPSLQFDGAPLPVLCKMPLLTDLESTPFNEPTITASILEDVNLSSPLSPASLEQTASTLDKVFKSLVETQHQPALKNTTAPLRIESVETVNRPAVTFSLSMWFSHDDWLVVDSRKPQAALPTSVLLRNIIDGLWKTSLPAGAEEIWHWPFVGNSRVFQTEAHAKDALSVWIEVAHEQRGINKLLVMGEVAWRFINIPTQIYEESLWQHYSLESGVTAWVVPSLVDLLKKPLDKKKLWQCLRAPQHD